MVEFFSCGAGRGGKGGSKGLFLGKMGVFLLAMAQEMTYFLDILSE